ncbi:MAG: MoaD/ThiS family protein [Desulfurococcaceae archaeon]
MIDILILPERRKMRIEREEMRLNEILELLDIDEFNSVAVLVNNKLVNEENYLVKKGDKVVLIKQATGGL